MTLIDLDEVAERFVDSVLETLADFDDDEVVHPRLFFRIVGAMTGCGLTEEELRRVPEVGTVADFKRVMRFNKERLAAGDGPSRRLGITR